MTGKFRTLTLTSALLFAFAVSSAQTASTSKPRATSHPKYDVSGQVDGLAPNRHVTLKLTAHNKPARSVINRPDGGFTLRNVPPGTYEIRPSHPLYSFSPAFHTVAVTTHDVQGVQFNAHERPKKKR